MGPNDITGVGERIAFRWVASGHGGEHKWGAVNEGSIYCQLALEQAVQLAVSGAGVGGLN